MRYYTQFHRWSNVYVIACIFGAGCLGAAAYYRTDAQTAFGYIVCGIFALVAAWMLYKSQSHYLDISEKWIEHNGFKNWKIKKTDIVKVEHGRKSWVDERDLFLTVYSHKQNYSVDSGFLLSEQIVEEIARAMRK